MRSQTVTELLERLDVRKSHNRPYVSNDNPYSESQFKTLKYQPTYPDRFGSIEDGKHWFRGFFHWYNEEHHHHGIAMFTPMQVHTGQWIAVHQRRQVVLDASYAAHPERFPRPPQAKRPPENAWICKPSESKESQGDESL
jgi:putative transposase